MTDVFFTADTHIHHAMVAGLRGYGDVSEHDEWIVDQWNSLVTKRDHVWHLGDLTLMNPNSEYIRTIVGRLNGFKHLVLGNHDRAHPVFKLANNALRHYLQPGMFEDVQLFARRKLSGKELLLSHFPYSGDHGADRFSQYRLRDVGIPVIHGHTHSEGVHSRSVRGTQQFHVGWDAWQRPVAQEEVY